MIVPYTDGTYRYCMMGYHLTTHDSTVYRWYIQVLHDGISSHYLMIVPYTDGTYRHCMMGYRLTTDDSNAYRWYIQTLLDEMS